MKARGYTLVELLVVIAIVAILAAMIAPVLLQAKEASKMRVCASNLRQLGTAIISYMDDNCGYGLPQSSGDFRNPWVLCVVPLVPKYIPVRPDPGELPQASDRPPYSQWCTPKRIWVCPGDIVKGAITSNKDNPYWYNFGSSFMYPGPTAYLPGSSYLDKPTPPRRAYKPYDWLNHKRDILLADYWFDFHIGGKVPKETWTDLTPTNWVNIKDTKSINILFLDMHLKSCTAFQREQYLEYTTRLDNPNAAK